MKRNKLLLLLVLLLTAATGAWATDETLLTTITNTGENASFTSGSKTFDDIATVTFSGTVHNDGDGWGWYAAAGESKLLTVAGADGYTITRVKFYSAQGSAFDEEAPFEATVMSTHAYVNGTDIGQYGVTKIEVYGYEGTAEPASAGYTVSMKDGVKDADKWTVKVGDGQAQALPIGGLKGDGSETVTLQYTGRLKVKGVKATSEAAEASVPDGALNGKFSVSDGKQVYFSKGNLRYASSKWSFFDNQYDYYTSYSADAWDHFGWSTSATDYGKNTSTTRSDYSGDFVDWGATMGTGWRTLSSDEWTYLFNTRSASTVGGTENGRYAKAKVNNVRGIILFPDTYTHPDGVNAPTGVNATGDTGWNGNSYTAADWTKMETAGCVFLPAAGYRNGSSVNNPGSVGDYSSATPSGTEKAYELYFSSGSLNTASEGSRFYGLSVRLVSEVTTSDAEPEVTYTLLSAATTSDCGKVVCAAGHLHDAKTAVPTGCTAVGILGKVTETGHGLILALQDAAQQNWNTIDGWTSVTSYAGTTLKVLPDDAARGTNLTSYTALGETAVSNWAVGQKSDYEAIFNNLGSTTSDSDGTTYDAKVNSFITTGVGGTAISGNNWTATVYGGNFGWDFESNYWNCMSKTNSLKVRPVLGF